ncbi:hypothetical protein GCM10008090_16350 [Arenicella chitinivorans]|uniref:Uncharacterized protein n=1 Tax=Arenicella chitinivorans TaxID=1329800 RepID=A0A918VM06_9GAMM|nr:hypothetical protein [Arenicella chitinivorans]GHA07258.1 hypothetical protein GCM10008090_16350 [Arenicella chitinivorans]
MSKLAKFLVLSACLSISIAGHAQKDTSSQHSYEAAELQILERVGASGSRGTIKVTSLEEDECIDCVKTYIYDSNTQIVLRRSKTEVDPSQLHRYSKEIAQVYADGEGYIWMIGFVQL